MDTNIVNNNITADDGEDMFSLTDFLKTCLQHWKMFVISVIVFCGLGLIYAFTRQPVYERSTEILIKDKDSQGNLASAFSMMGLPGSNSNVNNELISMTSPYILCQVITRLGLQVDYEKPGLLHPTTLYGTTLPVTVIFHSLDEQEAAGFEMEFDKFPAGPVTLSKFYVYDKNGKKIKTDKTVKCNLGQQTTNTPVGEISIIPNPVYTPEPVKPYLPAPAVSADAGKPFKIKVSRDGIQNTVERYKKSIGGDLVDKDADVIQLSIKDVSAQRAVAVLDEIVAVYNESWVEDKNRISVATSNFIDERLRVIHKELGEVEDNLSDFKTQNLLPDLGQVAKLALEQSSEMTQDMLDITNKLAMANYLKDFTANPANQDKVIPVNTGTGSNQLEVMISEYNNLLLRRNNIAESSSDKNPIVLDIDTQLQGLRESITRGIDSHVNSLNASLRNMSSAKGSVTKQLAANPGQAKILLSIERQQKVKESLYLFLLQKREDNELNQAFTAYSTRIITPPTGSLKPVSPKKMMILAGTFLLGLLVPGVFLYISEATNTRIRGRKDLDGMSIPYAGEIPFVGGSKGLGRFFRFKKKQGRDSEKALAVVCEGQRDPVNESFRVIRGNIDFMKGKHSDDKVIMLTSFNPGSGKSFVSYNLAVSFALKGKKVLIIDGDLRHGSISQYVGMPGHGLTDYLTGVTDDWNKYVVKMPDARETYILPIGHRPPNPSELLDSDRLKELLDEARAEYDYILIDCPPVDIVVDTQIVEKYVDRTLFVIRAGLFEKKSLPELEQIYKEKRFKQMCVILNGTDAAHSRGSYYGSNGYHNKID